MAQMILNFPEGYTPSKHQAKIITEIEKAIANNDKFIVCNAPTGCLTGDTEIMLNRKGNGGKMTLFKAYCKTHGNHMQIPDGYCGCGCGEKLIDKRSKCLQGHHSHGIPWKGELPKIRSLLDDNLGSQSILDIVYSGKKEVYEIELNSGYKLKGTACHPILTERGYIPLGELQTTDNILIDPIWNKNISKNKNKKTKTIYDLHVHGLNFHPFARKVTTKKYKDGVTYRVPKHIFVYEAHINNLSIDELKIRCKTNNISGLFFIDPSINVIHHIDHDHSNNTPTNLQLMTPAEHLSHHAKDNVTNLGYFKPKTANMIRRTYIGIEDTYDVQCPDPHHNFVANGIVVHNSGKSFFAPTLANYFQGPTPEWVSKVDDYSIYGEDGSEFAESQPLFGVYALTITKSLQDQYKQSFDFAQVLKGQSNYQCNYDDSLTVDVAPCLYLPALKGDCWSCNRCSYYNDRNTMLKSEFAALNYSMYFALPAHLRKRKVLVLDEASELEDQLVSQFTCEIDIPFLMKTQTPVTAFPDDEKSVKVLTWLGKTVISIAATIESYKEYFKNKKGKDLEFNKKKSEYTKLGNLQKSMDLLISTFNDSQYIIEHVDKKIKFTPLKIDKLSKYLFDNADHIVLLSATIIDPVNFCKNLGIPSYKYIEIDSPFDAEKAPIYVLAHQKINYGNLKTLLPTICKQIEGILNEHGEQKGIIHTHTQYIADYIRDNVKSKRLICREMGVTNEDILKIHSDNDDPTVLVSPSMTYGVDLKGKLAEFQIILKAPWLPTKDVRVEKMMKLDKEWYSNKMLCTLVQACGRGVRGDTDECVTYVLDGSIFDTVARSKKKLPKYFLDRFQ